MNKSLKSYLKKHNEIYLPYVAEKFNLKPEIVTRELLEYSNWTFKDNLVIFDYNGSRPNWIEVCDTKYKRGKVVPKDKIDFYSNHNRKEDQHVSVFIHDDIWREYSIKNDNVRCSIGNISPQYIYLELDRDSLEEAVVDAGKIRDNFPYPEFMTFWYSGNRSVHIEVDPRLFGWEIITDIKTAGYGNLYYNLAHKIAGDARHNNGISDPHLLSDEEVFSAYYKTFKDIPNPLDIQKMKKLLEVIDPNIYNKNSLIRQSWSKHEKGGKWKEPIKELNIEKESEPKPHLLHWTFECFETKKKTRPNYKVNVSDDIITKVYSENINYFDIEEVNEDGWINKLYSPFYSDTNPSVSVNILTGWYKDFGVPEHSFDIYTFYSKIKNIGIEDAKEKLRET
jgi:hypothetical protein